LVSDFHCFPTKLREKLTLGFAEVTVCYG